MEPLRWDSNRFFHTSLLQSYVSHRIWHRMVYNEKIYDRENEPAEKLDKLFIYTIAATLVGARFGHVFFYDWNYFSKHPEEILLPFRFKPQFEYTGFYRTCKSWDYQRHWKTDNYI